MVAAFQDVLAEVALDDVARCRASSLSYGNRHNGLPDGMEEALCMPAGEQFLEWLSRPASLFAQVFDCLPDVLFYIKDAQGRYLWVNRTLVERSGFRDRSAVVGKMADQLFPVPGSSTMAQDMEVIRTRRPIRERPRLYRTRQGEMYWCLSSKFPMRDASNKVVGLVGLSRDLPRSNERHHSYHRLARFLEYLDQRFCSGVRISEAAKHASLSMDSLERLVLEVFHLTPRQLLMKKRIDKACQLLEEPGRTVTQIAHACGYADHSAFTRQFKAATGITPLAYRATHKASVPSIGQTQ